MNCTKAVELVREYVKEGFTKIHIDTSMQLGTDRTDVWFDPQVIAERGAQLCEEAEKAYAKLKTAAPAAVHPVYVIGSEVPVPGGTQEEDGIKVTQPSSFKDTVELFRNSFQKRGLENAWGHVIAVVVQPGVEFGEEMIHEYNREAARELCSELKKYHNLVFEGRSTDYQKAASLKEMVEDGIAILKAGPALTFALREGLFLLNQIEREMLGDTEKVKLSEFVDTLESSMLQYPENWHEYYHGSEQEKKIKRKYSLSDRCRYYLTVPDVKHSMDVLIGNLRSVEMNMSIK